MSSRELDLATVRERAERLTPRVAELAELICLIPAPSGAEAERARFVAAAFEQRGMGVEVDEINNVYVRRRGAGRAPTLMLSAHTDTVFPAGTPISVAHEPGRLIGPSIGDNSLGVAGLLILPELLDELRVRTPGDLLLLANVGEEGLGNLRGIRAAVDRFAGELGGAVAIEGHNLGRVTHAGVGSKRIRATVSGPGGHSWGAFGEPSAIHELAGIIHEIAGLSVPTEPKTTYNVGLIEGGVSVNTIAPRASGVIDMRSEDAGSLGRLDAQVEQIINRYNTSRISTEIEVLGERPAGRTPESAPIVRAAIDVLQSLDIRPELNASSTDANIPIARGIPAICVGLTHGSGSHRVDEMIEIGPVSDGLMQLALLAARFPVAGDA